MKHRDPITGDKLSGGEYVSWIVQGIIRRWAFLGMVLLITALCWMTRDATILLWWNLCASLLAIVIENIVGIAMFSQTRRDALILRRIDKLEEQNHRLLERIDMLLEQKEVKS